MGHDAEPRRVDDNQLTAIGAHVGRQLPHLSVQEAHDLVWAVRRLVESFHPECVYVFGSHARGTPGPNSDIDLMLVVRDTDQPLHRLEQQGYGVLEPYRLPIELPLRWVPRAVPLWRRVSPSPTC